MATPSLRDDLARIEAVQAHLPGPVVILIGLAAAAATLPAAWAYSQYLYVIAHEGGHAFMGSLMGRRITSVTMKRDGTGLTISQGKPGIGGFLFQFFGYLGPSAFGVGAAKLIQLGHIVAVLWLFLLALLVLLFAARGFVAWLCISCTGAGLFLIAQFTLAGVQVAAAYGITWFLLISGVAIVLRHGKAAGDASLLRTSTHLPEGLWPLLWFAGSTAALITGAVLLI